MSICNKTIKETSQLLKTKKIGSVELTHEYLRRINQKNSEINAYLTLCEDYALKAAQNAQKLLDSGEETSILCGIPMGVKDNICTKDIKTTCASKMLENFRPPYSATVFEIMEKQGTVLLGKLNMDEFSMGSSSEHSYFGTVRNPWNTAYLAGGSSGGSAASVSGNLAVFSLGSDTGGGIRQPASLSGAVGLKPTYGRISRHGLIAFASSMDQIGPITKDITDCAIIMNAITGNDPLDSTSIKPASENYLDDINIGVNGLKIGIPKEFFDSSLDAEIGAAISSALNRLQIKKATLVDTSLPSIKNSISAYYIISSSEASSNLARYDGIRFGYRNEKARNISELYELSRGGGFGREVKRRILLGTYALSSDKHDELYNKALKVRSMITADFNNSFEQCDIIAAPVYPTTAFKMGEKLDNPLKMYLGDIYTVGVNLAGLPALSVPCGVGKNDMPIGLQLIGRSCSEKLLLRVGYALENEMGRLSIHQREDACSEL